MVTFIDLGADRLAMFISSATCRKQNANQDKANCFCFFQNLFLSVIFDYYKFTLVGRTWLIPPSII